ncbi:glycoside hydrolase family 9 protein [Caldithrix abyssi]
MGKVKQRALFFLLIITIVSSAQSTVFVNQVGYLPDHLKMAYTDHAAESFSLIDLTNNRAVFSGEVVLLKENDPSSGLDVYLLDFSGFQSTGRFKIRLNDGEESVPFEISDSVFSRVADRALKGLYYQRCGMTLEEAFAGVFNHGTCHSADAIGHSTCEHSGYLNVRGGWHDAGDYGKYVAPAAHALSYLLMLAEYFPSFRVSDRLNIPESGNGIPDLLDEARYELQWLLTMQDANSGGVFFKVTTKDFVGYIMPNKSFDARYLYQISSTATADFAAIMARAYRVYKDYDSTFASQCLSAAQHAWSFLEAHPVIVPDGGFQNPADTKTGEYGDADDGDERLWAAAELFEATAATEFNDYFLNHYQDEEIIQGPAGWQYVKPLALITYLKSAQPTADENARNIIKNALDDYCRNQVAIANDDGFHVALEDWEYYWGSNSVALNKALILIFMFEETGKNEYFDTALHQLNYILGCNAHNMTFVTGLGTNVPRHIHHRPSIADGVQEPVPGLMAGGPNKYLNDLVLQLHFNANTPPALCYVDNQESYASNEVAVYWNAPLIFVGAYFNQGRGPVSLDSRPGSRDLSLFLAQNFPNPFNNQTTIVFKLKERSPVTLEVFDMRGEKVRTLLSDVRGPGYYRIIWDGKNGAGQVVSTGLYLYRLKTDRRVIVKKIVFIR